MKPAFHTSVQKEREKQAAEEMGFTFRTAGWERERDGEGSGGFVGDRKNLGEILEREAAVRVLTHKWNMSDLRSQKLAVVHTRTLDSNYHVSSLIYKNIDPESAE